MRNCSAEKWIEVSIHMAISSGLWGRAVSRLFEDNVKKTKRGARGSGTRICLRDARRAAARSDQQMSSVRDGAAQRCRFLRGAPAWPCPSRPASPNPEKSCRSGRICRRSKTNPGCGATPEFTRPSRSWPGYAAYRHRSRASGRCDTPAAATAPPRPTAAGTPAHSAGKSLRPPC